MRLILMSLLAALALSLSGCGYDDFQRLDEQTKSAWSEVLDKAETNAPGVGAIRLRLVAVKQGAAEFALKGEDGKYAPEVLLDLDYWALMPM